MYRICKGIDIDFAHHVRGHLGPCIHVHGHTWRFEVVLAARELDRQGFVVDFKDLKRGVLEPCHALLDHGLALGSESYAEVEPALQALGEGLLASRADAVDVAPTKCADGPLHGAENRWPGGLKLAVFPFAPTAERLAEWLHGLAVSRLEDERVHVELARVFETQRPVASYAEYSDG